MRQIKFRGLKIDRSGWIYGMPTYDFTHIFSEEQVDSCDSYEVISETIGQFTGLTDKNGIKIYEGDIIEGYKGSSDNDIYYKGFLEWNQQQGGFVIRCGKYIMEILSLATEGFDCTIIISKFEVIGNIHQNKNLL